MNPEMMRMAMEQMRNMTPAQMQQMQQMAANMDPAQMRQMQQMASGMDPATMRQMQAAAGSMGMAGGVGGAQPPPSAPAQAQQPSSTLAEATALKEAGNKLHSGGSYQAAVSKYQEARQKLGSDSTTAGRALAKACLLNLASCALKLERHANAEQYCDEVLAGEPSNVKALYRRGQALLAQGKAQAAVTDLERSIALSPPDDQAVMQEVLDQARAALPADSASAVLGDSGVVVEDVTHSEAAPAAPAPSAPSVPGMPPGGFSPDQLKGFGEMMANPGMAQQMEAMIGNMSQEQLDSMAAMTGQPRITKEQAQASISGLKGMTPEQLAAHARGQFTPGQAASPADLKRAAEMLQANPEMMQQSMDMMRNMRPEELAAAARAMGAPADALTPESISHVRSQVSSMTPDQLREAAQIAAAAHASQAGSAPPPQPSPAAASQPSPAPQRAASSVADGAEAVEHIAAPSTAPAAAPATPGGGGMADMFTPEMIQMASGMMASMTPEDMAAMSQMAGGMGAGGGGPPGPGGMPQMTPEMMAKMSSPEMSGMLQRMMKNMDPEQLSGMMKQSGMDISPEQAAQMKSQMERLSERQMRWLMMAAAGAQRAIAAAQRAKAYLAARPLLAVALVVLVIAILLRLLGWL